MQIARGVLGGILLFLGREFNFLFAATMAALIGFRLTPLLPAQWPGWTDYAFIGLLGIIAAAIPIINERLGFFLSGFLVGGYVFVEYYAPNLLTVPLLPFLGGGIIGTLIIGIFTDWALIAVSCLFGAYYLAGLFNLSPNAEILVTAGLFIIGAITQAIILFMQKKD
jgi:hypothetical protein